MCDARLPSLMTLLLAASAASAQVRVEPATVKLSGPGASYSLLVTNKRDGRDLDRTRASRYSSSAPTVARVDERGVIRAVGDGSATISVRGRRQQAHRRRPRRGQRQTARVSLRERHYPPDESLFVQLLGLPR